VAGHLSGAQLAPLRRKAHYPEGTLSRSSPFSRRARDLIPYSARIATSWAWGVWATSRNADFFVGLGNLSLLQFGFSRVWPSRRRSASPVGSSLRRPFLYKTRVITEITQIPQNEFHWPPPSLSITALTFDSYLEPCRRRSTAVHNNACSVHEPFMNIQAFSRRGACRSFNISASFGGDPISGNTTFQDNGSKKFVYVDLAYGKWTAFNNALWSGTLTLGKMQNPFVFSDMVFDGDYTPEGFAQQFAFNLGADHSIKFNLGQFMLDEISQSGGGLRASR
jgi:hypothetical protein